MLRTKVQRLASKAVAIRRSSVTTSGGIDLSAATPKSVADFCDFGNLNGLWKVEATGKGVNPEWLKPGDYVAVNMRERSRFTPLELTDDALIVIHDGTEEGGSITAVLSYEEVSRLIEVPALVPVK